MTVGLINRTGAPKCAPVFKRTDCFYKHNTAVCDRLEGLIYLDINRLARLYGSAEAAEKQLARFDALRRNFETHFGDSGNASLLSAPGRTEIAGNHTDHNRGCVLAASVDMDCVAYAVPSGDDTVTLYSEGYSTPFVVDISDSNPNESERETTSALIRGVAACIRREGFIARGFKAEVASTVLRGSGLSSSAAFEVLLTLINDALFNNSAIGADRNARISQMAENEYFMKPCGLMDQMASAVGGLTFIDFKGGAAAVEAIEYDFLKKGYAPCIVAVGGEHGDLTDQYAAIPGEMKSVANALGCEYLRECEDIVVSSIPRLKGRVSDRAILRAIHFVDENRRVRDIAAALRSDDIQAFLDGVTESGESSWKLLQNLYVPARDNQEMPLALEMSRRLLKGKGAWRIHGGGFAGTILAFVRLDVFADYEREMNAVFGSGVVKRLYIRPEGAVELK